MNNTSASVEDLRVWLAVCDTKSVILGKRSKNCNNAGQWGLFGGHVDEGESATDAVYREFREETGYVASPSVHPVREIAHGTVKHKDCIWYLMEVPSVDEMIRQLTRTDEVDDYVAMPVKAFPRAKPRREVTLSGYTESFYLHYSIAGIEGLHFHMKRITQTLRHP